MTSPVIESITSTTYVDATDHIIDYPVTVDAGDLLICVFGCDDNETVTFPNEGVDWNVIYREDAGPQGPTLVVAWREAVGDEDGGTFTVTTGTGEGSCAYVFRITGAADPDTSPPEASVEGTGSSANPDSLSLSPTGGSKDYLWISAEANDDDDDTTGYPSNMADNNQYLQVVTVTLGIATEEVTTDTFDPAQFTIAAAESWEAVTIAVHPVAGPSTEYKTFTADVLLQKIGTDTITVDTRLVDQLTKTVTADVSLIDRIDKTITADTQLVDRLDKTFTGDVRFVDRLLETFTADVCLVDRLTKTITGDILLSKTDIKVFTGDVLLSEIGTKVSTADLVLIKVGTKDFTGDTLLKKTETKDHTADVLLQETVVKDLTADILLEKIDSKTFSADMVLSGGVTETKTFMADVVIVDREIKTFTGDVRLVDRGIKAVTADVVVLEVWYCTLNGTIVDTGDGDCDERGFDWGTAPGTYTEDWTEVGSYGVGSFSHQITGLDVAETYYFRAKAHNASGWSYGEEKSVVLSVVETKTFTADLVLTEEERYPTGVMVIPRRRRRERDVYPPMEWEVTLRTEIGIAFPQTQTLTLSVPIYLPEWELTLPVQVQITTDGPLVLLVTEYAITFKTLMRAGIPYRLMGILYEESLERIPVQIDRLFYALEGVCTVNVGYACDDDTIEPSDLHFSVTVEEGVDTEFFVTYEDIEDLLGVDMNIMQPSEEVTRQRDKIYIDMIEASDAKIREVDVRAERIEETFLVLDRLAMNDGKFKGILKVLVALFMQDLVEDDEV